jgi:small-conductance mechanosensitive channel
MAERMNLKPGLIRLAALFIGVTGPLAILLYLAIYARMYRHDTKRSMPEIQPRYVLARVLGGLVIALSLYGGAKGTIWLIHEGWNAYYAQTALAVGEWGWLELKEEFYLLCVLSLCIPLALLSAMPLANAWDRSLERSVHAILALYGVVLSFGIASLLVGTLIQLTQQFIG